MVKLNLISHNVKFRQPNEFNGIYCEKHATHSIGAIETTGFKHITIGINATGN